MLDLNTLLGLIVSNLKQKVGWLFWILKLKGFVWLLNGQLQQPMEMNLENSWFSFMSSKPLLKINGNSSCGWIKFYWILHFILESLLLSNLFGRPTSKSTNFLNSNTFSLHNGFIFSDSLIWWNILIQYQGQPLVVSFERHTYYLFKKGVCHFKDFWDFNSLD